MGRMVVHALTTWMLSGCAAWTRAIFITGKKKLNILNKLGALMNDLSGLYSNEKKIP